MEENFNIAKFLKENTLGSYGILGKYVDLKPLKEAEDIDGLKLVKGAGTIRTKDGAEAIAKVAREMGMKGVKVIQKGANHFSVYAEPHSKLSEAEEDLGGWDGDGENDQYDGKYDDESGPAITNELEKPNQIYTNEWMNDDIDGKKVGAWTCYYDDQQNVIYWLHDKINSEDVVVYATPGWDGAPGIACETMHDHGETVTDHETIGDNSYPDFESYAQDVTPYLNKVANKYFAKKNKMAEEVSISSSGVEMGADNFNADIKNMVDNIKQGYGYIDPEYVEQTWEMSSDIPFDSVKDKVLGVLTRLGLLKSDIDEADYISAKDFDYMTDDQLDSAEKAGDIKSSSETMRPNESKYPRADFADAVYAANKAGLSKEELIILVNQNAK